MSYVEVLTQKKKKKEEEEERDKYQADLSFNNDSKTCPSTPSSSPKWTPTQSDDEI